MIPFCMSELFLFRPETKSAKHNEVQVKSFIKKIIFFYLEKAAVFVFVIENTEMCYFHLTIKY